MKIKKNSDKNSNSNSTPTQNTHYSNNHPSGTLPNLTLPRWVRGLVKPQRGCWDPLRCWKALTLTLGFQHSQVWTLVSRLDERSSAGVRLQMRWYFSPKLTASCSKRSIRLSASTFHWRNSLSSFYLLARSATLLSCCPLNRSQDVQASRSWCDSTRHWTSPGSFACCFVAPCRQHSNSILCFSSLTRSSPRTSIHPRHHHQKYSGIAMVLRSCLRSSLYVVSQTWHGPPTFSL